jgi:hypothetical protein
VEKIHSKEELLQRLMDIRAVECIARDTYKDDFAAFKDVKIEKIINSIELDEEFHVKLLDELIEMLK